MSSIAWGWAASCINSCVGALRLPCFMPSPLSPALTCFPRVPTLWPGLPSALYLPPLPPPVVSLPPSCTAATPPASAAPSPALPASSLFAWRLLAAIGAAPHRRRPIAEFLASHGGGTHIPVRPAATAPGSPSFLSTWPLPEHARPTLPLSDHDKCSSAPATPYIDTTHIEIKLPSKGGTGIATAAPEVPRDPRPLAAPPICPPAGHRAPAGGRSCGQVEERSGGGSTSATSGIGTYHAALPGMTAAPPLLLLHRRTTMHCPLADGGWGAVRPGLPPPRLPTVKALRDAAVSALCVRWARRVRGGGRAPERGYPFVCLPGDPAARLRGKIESES